MTTPKAAPMRVPFFRSSLGQAELDEVLDTLRSGWLTTGPKVRRFEAEFAEAVGAGHAIALNSCTAALHLAVEGLGLKPGDGVLVPAMTFAATAEVVRYCGATAILVDCDPATLNIDLADAADKMRRFESGETGSPAGGRARVAGIIPVHVGGLMADVEAIRRFASRHGIWVVEDAAHAFPAAWRRSPDDRWQRCGEGAAAVTCFSFYANKTITTGEGGMAVTDDPALAARIRMMSLHGLSRDAWDRYSGSRSWDYSIVAPGYKYNLSDVAAAIGVHQLARAEEMRACRERVAAMYLAELGRVPQIELPPLAENRIHSWHLFPIKLKLDLISISRDRFIEEMQHRGITCSVHWRPLHLHPYYRDEAGWRSDDLPVASRVWLRLVSLPIFPSMTREETVYVSSAVRAICERYGS